MKTIAYQYFLVGATGALGAMLRLLVTSVCVRWFGTALPVGTFVVNISGSLMLGWFLALAGERGMSETTRLAVAVGFVGAYTTFSTFVYESSTLMHAGLGWRAIVNVVASVVVGLVAVRVGIWLGRG